MVESGEFRELVFRLDASFLLLPKNIPSWKVFMAPRGVVLLLRDKNLWYILFQISPIYIRPSNAHSEMDATKTVRWPHLVFFYFTFTFLHSIFKVMVLFLSGALRCYRCFSSVDRRCRDVREYIYYKSLLKR